MVAFLIPYLVLCARAAIITVTRDEVGALASSSSSASSSLDSSTGMSTVSGSTIGSTSLLEVLAAQIPATSSSSVARIATTSAATSSASAKVATTSKTSTTSTSSTVSTVVSTSSESAASAATTSSTTTSAAATPTTSTPLKATSSTRSSSTTVKSTTSKPTIKATTKASTKSSSARTTSVPSTLRTTTSSTSPAATTTKATPFVLPMLFAASSSCVKLEKTVTFAYWKGKKTSAHKTAALKALDKYKKWLKLDENKEREAFKYSSGDIVGYMWVGSMIKNSDFADSDAFKVLYNEVKKDGIPSSVYIESVDSDPMKTFGITLNVGGSKKLGTVQDAAKKWSQGKKYNSYTGSKTYKGKNVCFLDYNKRKAIKNDKEVGTCEYVKVKSGQNVADTAGVNGESLQGYNPSVNFNNLAVGQRVCKSIGTLPNLAPKKNKDGSCKSYTVVKGDTCTALAAKYSPLKASDIEKYNSKTYGWKGCKNLLIGQKICLSSGTAPKPAVNPDAECGPTAPGSLYNTKCPLNACCSDNGFCGTTSEHCSVKKSSTGAPGTKGCFSNCGYGKVHTDKRSDFKNLAYWLDEDGALKKDPSKLTKDYSILHYAFVPIKSDLSIDTSEISKSSFLKVKGVKKVASIGGGDFSMNSGTSSIFPKVIKSANRDKFATAVAAFVKKYNLDGVDLDWEYPSTPSQGSDYYKLIKAIKGKLASGKTLSVAVPASYYNLKNYPLKDIQNYVDYIVYMTYDLHGTWDKSSDPYMRCHTDKTDVVEAIKMLDKAGIQMSKIYAGLANYGRSYQAASKSCLTLGCKYKRDGKMGNIMKTRGFLLYSEIDDFIKKGLKNDRWTNSKAMCDVMVYDGSNLVAWPKKSQVDSMRNFFHNSGLKGSALWAANYY